MPRRRNQLPPPYVHSPEDMARANQAWTKTRLPASQWPLLDAMNDVLSRVPPKLDSKWPDPLNTGGTLRRADIKAIKIIDAQGDEQRLRTYVAPLRAAVSELTGIAFTGTTIKAYGPDKVGLGPHRDANFDDNKTAQVATLGAKGLGRFCLWIAPRECVYESERAFIEGTAGTDNPMVVERMADADNPIIVEVSGRERALYPVQSINMSPGDVITVDETPEISTWEGQGGYTELLHSAHRIDPIRWALLFRSEIMGSDEGL